MSKRMRMIGGLRKLRFVLPVLLVLGFSLGMIPLKAWAGEHMPVHGEFGPKLRIQGFADVNFISKEDIKGFEERPNTFSLGQMDLFVTSELSQKSNFLAEMVFSEGEGNHTEFHPERAFLEYSHNSLLRLKIGRMHTAISYWNTEYHHGRWFHTTVFRPKFYGWEDHGRGVLPNHMVGMFLHGKKEADLLDISYGLGLVNGRGKVRHETQDFQDSNDHKAVNGHLRFSANRLPGLLLGFNGYIDRIPEDDRLPIDPARAGEIKEKIWGGFIVYNRTWLEMISEYTVIVHDDEVSTEEYDSRGFYFQFSVHRGAFRPYYRLEYSDLDEGDPYWTDLQPLFDDYTANTFGLKWDITFWSSLKLEYRFNNNHVAENSNDFYIQSAFTF